MTQNQINYWSMLEQRRANQAKEAENLRHNTATEQIDTVKNRESKRHNIAQENLNYISAMENQRHNYASEKLSSQSIDVSRSNVQLGYGQLGYQYAALGEQTRHNVAQEVETQTNDEALAAIKAYESETSRMKAQWDYDAKQQQINLGYAQLGVDQQNALSNAKNAETQSWRSGVEAAGKLVQFLGIFLK